MRRSCDIGRPPRRCALWGLLLLALSARGAPTTMVFQDGVSPTTAYQGTRDIQLKPDTVAEWDPNANYSSSTELHADGIPVQQAILMRWDLSSIPAGSTITQVQLQVRLAGSGGSNFPIYECLRPWVESEATGNHYRNALSGDPGLWTVPGAAGVDTDRGGTVLGVMSGGTGITTFTLNSAGVATVQAWVNKSRPNNGFVIENYAAVSALDLYSFKALLVTDRPMLKVTLNTGAVLLFQNGLSPTVVYSGGSGTLIANGLPPGYLNWNGYNITAGSTHTMLLSFDLSAIPAGASITSAWLLLYARESSTSTFGVFRQLRPWSETRAAWLAADGDGQSTWTLWEQAGDQGATDRETTAIGTVGPPVNATMGEYPLDANGVALVQGWVDGTVTNAGLAVANASSSIVQFASREAPSAVHHPALKVVFTPSTALAVTPAKATTNPGGTIAFVATGGTAPYTFKLSQNLSGATLDASGQYAAGTMGGVTDVVEVQDTAGAIVFASVDVGNALTLSPSTADVDALGALQLQAGGGVPPYLYAVAAPSGGSVDAQGLYQAGPVGGVDDTVTVTDSTGAAATATIHVHALPVVPSSARLDLHSELLLASAARPGTLVTVTSTVTNPADGGALGPSQLRFVPEGLTPVGTDGGSYDDACGCFPLPSLDPGAQVVVSQAFLATAKARQVAVTTVVSDGSGELAEERVSAPATPLRANYGCGCSGAGWPAALLGVWVWAVRRRRGGPRDAEGRRALR